jgi:thymidylate synthase
MDSNFINANLAFQQLYDYIIQHGKVKDGTKFIRNVSFTMLSPWLNEIKCDWRKWKKDYAQLEWEWYQSGDRNPSMVEKEAKIWATIKDDSGYVNSNYGSWWMKNNQYQRMVNLLARKPTTRRAIIVHYSVDEIQNYEKDTPCNVVLNFYIEDNKIHLTIFARSIDLVYGFCNDQYCFSKLLGYTSSILGMGCGTMHYFITDLHVYEKHWDMKNKFYNKPFPEFPGDTPSSIK